ASNPQDEAFVVNFNDDFYLDLDKDFTNSVPELKEALERIDSRGSTALYDAIIGSLDHLKKASKDKRTLLIVTDGEDNTSHNSLDKTIREIQKTDTVIYTIGLLSEESKKNAKRAKRALEDIAKASGGLAFFPENVSDVKDICENVAHDIRNQYTLAYYPTNTKRDGTFRTVQVEVIPPHGRGKLTARTRNGYYAPGGPAGATPGICSAHLAARGGTRGSPHLAPCPPNRAAARKPYRSSCRLRRALAQFSQKALTVWNLAAKILGDALPHIRKGVAYAEIDTRATRRRIGEDGHVLSRMICRLPA